MEKVLIETWNDELSIITRKSENAKGLLEFELDFFTTKNQNKLKKQYQKIQKENQIVVAKQNYLYLKESAEKALEELKKLENK